MRDNQLHRQTLYHSTEVRDFSTKFNENDFCEKWQDLPTSSNIGDFICHVKPIGRVARILDLCCGTGKAVAALVKHFTPSDVVLIDRSLEALEIARQVADGVQNNGYFLCQSAEEPIPSDLGFFDVVVIRYALQLIQHPERLLRRLYCLIRPGGRILFNYAGSTIYNFRNARLNAVPDSYGRAHPFFGAVYQATFELQDDILSQVPSSKWAHLMSSGALHKKASSRKSPFTWSSTTQVSFSSVKNMVTMAGIPLSSLSFKTTWISASFDDKVAYSMLFGAPPVPGVWNAFNLMPKFLRQEYVNRIMHRAKKLLRHETKFRFPEPLFWITRHR